MGESPDIKDFRSDRADLANYNLVVVVYRNGIDNNEMDMLIPYPKSVLY